MLEVGGISEEGKDLHRKWVGRGEVTTGVGAGGVGETGQGSNLDLMKSLKRDAVGQHSKL